MPANIYVEIEFSVEYHVEYFVAGHQFGSPFKNGIDSIRKMFTEKNH